MKVSLLISKTPPAADVGDARRARRKEKAEGNTREGGNSRLQHSKRKRPRSSARKTEGVSDEKLSAFSNRRSAFCF